ncbi:MAG: DUF3450 family protein [Opitutaceae bacterium]|jgi:hypothetical protein
MKSCQSGSALLLAALLCPSLFPFTIKAADSVESIQKEATEWAKLRMETVRLETDWTWQREMMQSTLAALQERGKTLQEKRDQLQAKAAADPQAAGDLEAKNEAARAMIGSVEKNLKTLSEKLVRMRPALPPRLSQALELPYRSLADPALGTSEHLQHAMTLLNRCAQFNKAISYGEEEMTLPGAQNPRLIEVIYWGMSHGYALDRVNNIGYFGYPAKTGWTWEADPGIAKQVALLIAIHKDKSDPAFVEIPARLGSSFAENTKE